MNAFTPRATLRLQFHSGFTLDDAYPLVPYFSRLGISHLYSSPLSQARPGSTHGYDVIDPARINDELGGEPALRRLVQRLHAHDMGLILDIVPNHMAADPRNPWWRDVLRQGLNSPYAQWFDIDWHGRAPALHGKVLLPVLGKQVTEAVRCGDIEVRLDTATQVHCLYVHGLPYPLREENMGDTLTHASPRATAGSAEAEAKADHDSDTPDAPGARSIHALIARQHYQLACWLSAAEEINWRRFFEISDLVGVRVERADTFEAIHALPLRLFEEGLVDGLRIDHIDGLADPRAYCMRLRKELDQRAPSRLRRMQQHTAAYLVVEKILHADEPLPDWPVQGTTGYDFMDLVGAVLHDPDGQDPLRHLWARIAGDARPPEDYIEEARALMLSRHFPAERNALVNALWGLMRNEFATIAATRQEVDDVATLLLQLFPVYRTYMDARGRSDHDAALFGKLIRQVAARIPGSPDQRQHAILNAIDACLGGQSLGDHDAQQQTIQRFQQLTPPLAAKSLEDTVFYRYGPLLSRNEVGSTPHVFAIAASDFHDACLRRLQHCPHAMLATATHDHKRGEDARARLAVLSEIPDEWEAAITQWLDQHSAQFINDSRRPYAPHIVDRYMLYQSLIGAWPMDLLSTDPGGIATLKDRLSAWQPKALREAKLRSSWFEPDESYEALCQRYIDWLLSPPGHNRENANALSDVESFIQRLMPAGALNSLAQTVLRLTAPGVPDLYQGTEFWDFSLVDPDNRRPVDFDARIRSMDEDDPPALVQRWRDGHLKANIIKRCLNFRATRPTLFAEGEYIPVKVRGPAANHAIAFIRQHGNEKYLTLISRLAAKGLSSTHSPPVLNQAFWNGTQLDIAERAEADADADPGSDSDAGADADASSANSVITWTDILTGQTHRPAQNGNLDIAPILSLLPVAVLAPGTR